MAEPLAEVSASWRSAARPATWGAAAEVPAKPLSARATVGASNSGFDRPSVDGPREEKAAAVSEGPPMPSAPTLIAYGLSAGSDSEPRLEAMSSAAPRSGEPTINSSSVRTSLTAAPTIRAE
jgi:hypothetical protein